LADNANDNGAAKYGAGSQHAGRFKPLADALAARDEYNDVLRNRIDKACALLDADQQLYPNTFRKDTHIGDILSAYSDLDEAALAEVGKVFLVAGRMTSLRSFGKVTFIKMLDASESMQVFVARDELGQEPTSSSKNSTSATSSASRATCSAPRPASSPCAPRPSAWSPSPCAPCRRSTTA
jgi:Lysyl-tRNA synthetase (class II)